MKRLDVSTDSVPGLVGACCVLHNMCEVQGDNFDQEWMEGTGAHKIIHTHQTLQQHHSLNRVLYLYDKAFMAYFTDS